MEIDKKKEASLLRGSIRLYLDVLNDKLNRFLLDQSPLVNAFETLAKQNHDALEDLFLRSDPLEFEEREKLGAFVRFFKGTPAMNKEDFPAYKTELEGLMKVFPEEKTKQPMTTITFNPKASFLHLTAGFTRKVRREIKRDRKNPRNLDRLFGTMNKNFHKTQPFSYETAETILKREGPEAITMFFWFNSSAGELAVYGPAANRGEIEKAYQYIQDILERKKRQRQGWQKFWSVVTKVGIIVAIIIGAIAIYKALTSK